MARKRGMRRREDGKGGEERLDKGGEERLDKGGEERLDKGGEDPSFSPLVKPG